MFLLKKISIGNISLISFILILSFSLATLTACSKNEKDSKQEHKSKQTKNDNASIIRKGVIDVKSIDENNDGYVYQDMMDWNVISDEAGKCPVCGMKLKKVSIEDAEKNLTSHNFQIKQAKEKASIIREGIINVKSIDKNKDGYVYQDMMDWNVISDEAGNCPVCGMKLKKVSIDEAKNNLISHKFQVK